MQSSAISSNISRSPASLPRSGTGVVSWNTSVRIFRSNRPPTASTGITSTQKALRDLLSSSDHNNSSSQVSHDYKKLLFLIRLSTTFCKLPFQINHYITRQSIIYHHCYFLHQVYKNLYEVLLGSRQKSWLNYSLKDPSKFKSFSRLQEISVLFFSVLQLCHFLTFICAPCGLLLCCTGHSLTSASPGVRKTLNWNSSKWFLNTTRKASQRLP